jgi:hypothetical protein
LRLVKVSQLVDRAVANCTCHVLMKIIQNESFHAVETFRGTPDVNNIESYMTSEILCNVSYNVVMEIILRSEEDSAHILAK